MEKQNVRVIMDEEGLWAITTQDTKKTYKNGFDCEDSAWKKLSAVPCGALLIRESEQDKIREYEERLSTPTSQP